MHSRWKLFIFIQSYEESNLFQGRPKVCLHPVPEIEVNFTVVFKFPLFIEKVFPKPNEPSDLSKDKVCG